MRALLLFLLLGAPVLAGAAVPAELEALQSMEGAAPVEGEEAIDQVRLKAMQETALSVGVQAGAHYESARVNELFDKNSAYLDAVYDMTQLMLRDEKGRAIRPPVITEGWGEAHLDTTGQVLRTVSQTFRQEVPARFILTTPSWRDYLYVQAEGPADPLSTLLPTRVSERSKWKSWVEQGWRVGVNQVHDQLMMNLSRLTRDYIGMVRYHLLLTTGQVTAPKVVSTYRATSGGGDTLNIEDIVLAISVKPSLNANSDQWKAIPKLGDFRWLGYPFPKVNLGDARNER